MGTDKEEAAWRDAPPFTHPQAFYGAARHSTLVQPSRQRTQAYSGTLQQSIFFSLFCRPSPFLCVPLVAQRLHRLPLRWWRGKVSKSYGTKGLDCSGARGGPLLT